MPASSPPPTRARAPTSSIPWRAAYLLPLLLGLAIWAAPWVVVLTRPPIESWPAPPAAQYIDQKSMNALDVVESQEVTDGTYLFIPPGTTPATLKSRPFHIYSPHFHALLGSRPSLTLIAQTPTDPLFHEAIVWWPPTDTVFFAQNAGARAAGTGLLKSSVLQSVSLAQVISALQARGVELGRSSGVANLTGQVDVADARGSPPVVNPNGGTNYRQQLLFAGEGQGPLTPPALYLMDPAPPHNTTVPLNNFHGRQFNSLNDVAVHPGSGCVYFTDVDYGFLQEFRAGVGLRRQVYRWCEETGVVRAVTDEVFRPNGITFSPDGSIMYVTDTGAAGGFTGMDWSQAASIYQYPVRADGTIGPASLFAFVTPGVPDGIHCDAKGNVYAGAGDGVHVWDPRGELLGKIYTWETVANFAFAGAGRMVICAETKLYYATLAAEGAWMPGLAGVFGADARGVA